MITGELKPGDIWQYQSQYSQKGKLTYMLVRELRSDGVKYDLVERTEKEGKITYFLVPNHGGVLPYNDPRHWSSGEGRVHGHIPELLKSGLVKIG